VSLTLNESPLLIAQVTDIHLFADEKQELLGLGTTQSFQAVIEQLQMLQPQLDLLLLTGDLSQDGTPESYERIQNLLSPLATPIYWLPGNHDCVSTMQQVLNRAPFSPWKAFTQSWNFLLINSGVPGYVHGHLSSEKLNWLDLKLEFMGDRPTIVALHHPPFRLNSDWLDTSTLENPEELFAVLDRHPQVKLVLFGHIHQEFNRQRNGIHYLGSPSTSIQFEPQSSNFSLDSGEKPGFRLLNLYPDGRWETRIKRVSYAHKLDLTATGY
jgi:Icc protein